MPVDKSIVAQINRRLETAGRILLVSHIRPDGDAIGSLLGLGLSLQAAGKDVVMALSDGIPASFRHLPGSEQVILQPAGNFDMIGVVDCSDLQRTGDTLNDYPQPDLNIDHHVTNLKFAKINLVDTRAVATTQILVDLLTALDLPFTQGVVDALLTGLITDTLGFRTSNMTPEALRTASILMEKGGDLPDLYQQALIGRSYDAVRFWGAGLSQLDRHDRLVWATLTQEDRQASGYPGRDDADLINILSSINEADIALIFVEQPHNRVKVSWRSRPGIDVSQIALRFGGGGHPSAAGADIPGTLEEVKSKVLQATHRLINGHQTQKNSINHH